MAHLLWKVIRKIGFAAGCCGLLLAGATLPGGAQDVADNFAYLSDGALWVWSVGDDYPTQVTGFPENAYTYVVEMSPDGRYIAAGVRIVILDEEGLLVDDYSDVWLYDIPSAALSKITPDHPLPDENDYVSDEVYGTPFFSPDGEQVAWVYYYEQYSGSVYGVDFYTIATGETRRVAGGVSLGYQDGGLNLPHPQWGVGGLLDVVATLGSGKQFYQIITVFDPAAETVSSVDIWREAMGTDQIPEEVQWTEIAGQALIAFRRADVWYTLNPQDGILTRYAGAPTTYLAGYARVITTEERGGRTFNTVSLITPEGEPVMLPEGAVPVAVTTGGGAVFFRSGDTNGVWQTGSTRLFDPPLNAEVAIGDAEGAPPVLRFEEVEPVETTTVEVFVRTDITPCFLPPRLQVGQTAFVVPGAGANVLRAEAGLDGVEIGSIPEAAQMMILDGSVCRNGYRWWQVDYDGQIGWTAEGDPQTGEYWLDVVQEDGE